MGRGTNPCKKFKKYILQRSLKKRRYNHGCNKLDNCNDKQKNRKNIITQSRTEMDL